MTVTSIGLCSICGERTTIRAAVIRWREPVFGVFEAIDRCVDLGACRERVERRGDTWPVLEPGERRPVA